MRYSKKSQLKQIKPRTQKEKGKITKDTYNTVIYRDGFKCVACGSKYKLECHHITSRGKAGGDAIPSNLCMLCHECHYAKWHGKGDFITKQKVYKYMISIGYTLYKVTLELLTSRNNKLTIGRQRE